MPVQLPRDRVWSRERWFMTITIVFVLQVVVAIWLSARGELPVREDGGRLMAYYQGPGEHHSTDTLLSLTDPSVYAMARPEGFSGDVWLKATPVSHRSPGWEAEPQFLPFDPGTLLYELESYGREVVPRRYQLTSSMFRKDAPRSSVPDLLKPAPRTVVEISGALTTADLLSLPDSLPGVVHNGVLEPSAVQIRVDQLGRVFSTVLSGRSGSDTADQLALKLARSLKFNAAPGFDRTTDADDFSRLRRAVVRVRWWTEPIPLEPAPDPSTMGTNQVPTTANSVS